MSFIPCTLDCIYQTDGICNMKSPGKISLSNEKCAHFVQKNKESKENINRNKENR